MNKTCWQWFFSGFLTGGSLIFVQLWPLVIVGLVWQLKLLLEIQKTKLVFMGAMIAGMVHIFVVHAWVWSLVPLSQLGFKSMLIQNVGIGVTLLGISFFIGAGYAAGLSLLHYVAGENNSIIVWAFPAAILGSEIAARLSLSLGILGPGGSLNISYGFGHIGYVLAEHSTLVLLAKYGGVYMLTLVIAGISVLLWVLWQKNKGWSVAMFFLIVGTVGVSPVVNIDIPEQITGVALVTTNVGIQDRVGYGISRNLNFDAVISEAKESDYHTIILPEDTRYLEVEPEGSKLNVGQQPELNVVDSSRVEYDNGPRLRTYAYSTQDDVVYSHDKQHLVPLGEYVPYVAGGLLRLFGLSKMVDESQDTYGYRPGQQFDTGSYSSSLPPVLFCYESIVPYSVKNILREDSDKPYVAHVVSHSWFEDGGDILKHELSAMLRIQAVWAGVYVLQSANLAPAVVYTPLGQAIIGPAASTENKIMVVGVDEILDSE